WLERALAIAGGHGGQVDRKRAGDEGGSGDAGGGAAGDWRRAFLEAPYLQSALISLGGVVDTFETACTRGRFDELQGALGEAGRGAMPRACGGGVLTSRFTHVYPDGPAPYYTFIAPARDGGELEQWAEIKRVASDTLAAHGATITHHHAVGR